MKPHRVEIVINATGMGHLIIDGMPIHASGFEIHGRAGHLTQLMVELVNVEITLHADSEVTAVAPPEPSPTIKMPTGGRKNH